MLQMPDGFFQLPDKKSEERKNKKNFCLVTLLFDHKKTAKAT